MKNMSSTTAYSTLTTETSEKINTELEHEDELEENSTTEYVKTISGKTINIKCDRKQ